MSTKITRLLSFLDNKYAKYMGIIYSLFCHFIFIATASALKKTGKRLTSFQMLYYVSIQLILCNFFLVKSRGLDLCPKKPRVLFMLILRGIIGSTGACLAMIGFTLISLAECTAIQMTASAITAVLAVVFFKEKYDYMQFINLVLCFTGVILISKPSFLFGDGGVDIEYPYRAFGITITIIASFFASFIQIILKKLGSMVSPPVNTFYFGVCLAIVTTVTQTVQGTNPVSFYDMFVLSIVGILQFVAHLALNRGFQLGNVGTISLMMYSQVLYAYLIDVFYEGVSVDFYSILGSCSIFMCVFITLFRLHLQSKENVKIRV